MSNYPDQPPNGYPPQQPGPPHTHHPPQQPGYTPAPQTGYLPPQYPPFGHSSPQPQAPKKRNNWLIAGIIIGVLALFGIVGAVASPYLPWLKPVDGYLLTTDTSVVFVHWTEEDEQIHGAWESTILEEGKVKSRTLPFTGTYNKDTGAISMDIDFTLLTVKAKGTVKDDTLNLELEMPMNETESRTLKAASKAEYKAALDAFKKEKPD